MLFTPDAPKTPSSNARPAADGQPIAASPDHDGPVVAPFPTTIYPSTAVAFDGVGDDDDGHGIDLETLLASLDVPRHQRPRRDSRPEWMRDLIDCVSALFEPLSHTGRVGYEVTPENGRWNLGVFLSAAEHIGGALDGHVETINFHFDIAALFRCFERVDRCVWGVFPTPESIEVDGETRGDIPDGLSSVVIEGLVIAGENETEAASVTVYSVPPKSSGIGLKLFAGGEARPS